MNNDWVAMIQRIVIIFLLGLIAGSAMQIAKNVRTIRDHIIQSP